MYVCGTCGQSVSDAVKFCPRCGASRAATMHGIRDFTGRNRPLDVVGKLVLCLLGLGLLFLLVQGILLKAYGVNTNAEVYRAEQKEAERRGDEIRLDPTRFEISYRYSVAGETYEGRDTLYFERGYVTEMGADGKPVPKTAVVRYLPSVPRWSEIVSVPGGKHSSHLTKNPLGWIGLVLLALIFAAVIRHNRRARKTADNGESRRN